MKKYFAYSCFWAGLLVSSPVLAAPQSSGVVTGQIQDQSGNRVPNLRVEAENVATGQRTPGTIDAEGRYRFENLAPGRYRIIATSESGTVLTRDVDVTPTGSATIDRRVSAAGTGAVMTDISEPAGRTDTSQISFTANTRMVEYLPQPNFADRTGRLFGAYNLGLLPAGVVAAEGPAVGGQSPASNNFHVEGADNNNRFTNRPLVYLSNEATSEFTLRQNKMGVELGHVTGGEFNSVVRGGTNQVHGSIYDYLQNRNFNAANTLWRNQGFNNSPKYDQNRLGATVGMPVIKDHLFFFGAFEYIPLSFDGYPAQGISLAPTAAGLATLRGVGGVSAANLNLLSNYAGGETQQTGVTTVQGVNIPVGPTTSFGRNWRNQYAGTGGLDWNIRHQDSLRLRYTHNENESNFTNTTLAGFLTGANTRSLLASASHVHTFGSTFTNELRFAFNRYTQDTGTGDFSFAGQQDFPSINIGGTLALGPSYGLARYARLNTYHLADSASIIAGPHSFQVGFDGRRTINTVSGFNGGAGTYAYSSLQRFLLDLPPDVQSQRLFNSGGFNANQWNWLFYLSDRWQVTPNFVLDLGLRYEYTTIPLSITRQGANSAADVPGILAFTEPDPQRLNFAPHVGMAWSPMQGRSTVIRAGFGMNYDTLFNFSSAFAPGTLISGLNQSATAGFLARGGLGAPALPTNSTLQARSLVSSLYDDQRLPYSMQWNAGIQQVIYRGISLEARYLGARTLNIPVLANLNSANITTGLPLYSANPGTAALNALPVTLAQLQSTASLPLAPYGFTNPIASFTNTGRSTYHALAVDLSNRFSGGFNMQGSYTYSHLIDNVDPGFFQSAYNRASDVADSVYDRRHRVAGTIMWDPATAFKGQNVVRNVIANLTLGGTFTYQSPGFATARSAYDANLDGYGLSDRAVYNAAGTEGVSSALTPLTNGQGQVVAYQIANPNAQYIQAAPGVVANAARNTLRLGQINNFDVFGTKRFSVRDRFAIEARADAYNVFNHSQYTGDPITSLYPNSLTGLPSFLVPGTSAFGNTQNFYGSRPRLLQLSLRLTF